MVARSLTESASPGEIASLSVSQISPAVQAIVKMLRYRLKERRASNHARPMLADELRKDFRTCLGQEIELEEVIADIESAWELERK